MDQSDLEERKERREENPCTYDHTIPTGAFFSIFQFFFPFDSAYKQRGVFAFTMEFRVFSLSPFLFVAFSISWSFSFRDPGPLDICHFSRAISFFFSSFVTGEGEGALYIWR